MKPAVLLIDNDLSFVFWLGQTLDRAGYEAFPAKSVADAQSLMAELSLSVGLVILNYSLAGADELIATLRNTQNYLKIIIIVEDADAPMPPDVDEQWRKPEEFDGNSRTECLQIIRRVLLVRALTFGAAEILRT